MEEDYSVAAAISSAGVSGVSGCVAVTGSMAFDSAGVGGSVGCAAALSRSMGSKKGSKQTEEDETARAAEESQLAAKGATDANPLVELLGLDGGGETTTTEAITEAPPVDPRADKRDPCGDAAKKLEEAVAENLDNSVTTSPAAAATKGTHEKKKLALSAAKPHAKRTRAYKSLVEELVALPV
ncbi:hypothetical protein T492DRAFT_872493 [Pavlovales sp. CCMP2436]|nr:hypothetical protein T492DRAFT_872493 [Pavlovales sp. CCMP2436]